MPELDQKNVNFSLGVVIHALGMMAKLLLSKYKSYYFNVVPTNEETSL